MEGLSIEERGKAVRNRSVAFLGQTAIAKLVEIANDSEDDKYVDMHASPPKTHNGAERGYVLYYTKNSKELVVSDVSENARRTYRSFEHPQEEIDKIKNDANKILFALGHTHGVYSVVGEGYDKDMANMGSMGKPSASNGPQDYLDVTLNRNSDYSYPAFLSTKHGVTIYSTQRNANYIEIQQDVQNRPNFGVFPNTGTVFDGNGNFQFNYSDGKIR